MTDVIDRCPRPGCLKVCGCTSATPPIKEPLTTEAADGAVREALDRAAAILDDAARKWRWSAGEEEGFAYRNRACVERRAEWGEGDCGNDGSCDECASDMHEHFETPASRERRRELRALAEAIRQIEPARTALADCGGEDVRAQAIEECAKVAERLIYHPHPGLNDEECAWNDAACRISTDIRALSPAAVGGER